MDNFQKCNKLGEYGESLVDDYLEKKHKRNNTYKPKKNKSHPFDRMETWVTDDGDDELVIVETKTKPSMYSKPETGFDSKDNEKYLKIMKRYNIPIYLFFVDFFKKGIFYQKLDQINKQQRIQNKEYPYIVTFKKEPCIMFHTSILKKARDLTDEECKTLFELDNMDEKHKKKYKEASK